LHCLGASFRRRQGIHTRLRSSPSESKVPHSSSSCCSGGTGPAWSAWNGVQCASVHPDVRALALPYIHTSHDKTTNQ
jgi:hypothetical protein